MGWIARGHRLRRRHGRVLLRQLAHRPPVRSSQRAFDLIKERKVEGEIKAGSDQIASVTDPFGSGALNQAGTVAYIKVSYKTTSTELTTKT